MVAISVSITVMLITAFIAGLFYSKKMYRNLVIAFVVIAIATTVLYNQKTGNEGKLAKMEVLQMKTKWETMAEAPIENGFAVTLKNMDTGEILLVNLKEKPPKEFTVMPSGWFRFLKTNKTRLVPIRQEAENVNQSSSKEQNKEGK